MAAFHPKLVYVARAAQGMLPTNPGGLAQRLCEQGQVDRALTLMDQQGSVPSVNMYRSLLKACAKNKAKIQVKLVQAHLSRLGLESTQVLSEDLMSTFVKCGAMEDARELFERMPCRTVYCWTTLISGYANAELCREALEMYKRMKEEGAQPNAYTFVSLLKSCASLGDLEAGRRIHTEVSTHELEADLFVGTCLVDMYGKCGSVVDAQYVFDGISKPDVVAWNALLAAHVEQRQAGKALELFDKMRNEDVTPSKVTYLTVLQACGMLGEEEEDVRLDGLSSRSKYLERGKLLHADICKRGYSSDVFVSSTLINMYGKCRSIVAAESVFNRMFQHNLVACTSMLAAYVHLGHQEKALQLFDKMREQGLSSDARTFVIVLQACGMLAEKEKNSVEGGETAKVNLLQLGRAIHADTKRKGLDSDVFISNTLISMYNRCGSILDAQNVFEETSKRDVVSWNAIMSAHVDHGQGQRALHLYEAMQANGLNPDMWTFVSALQACAMLADEEKEQGSQGCKAIFLEKGKSLHADAQKLCCDSEVLVAHALVTMYGKCGSRVDAQNVFNGLSNRNVVAWTAMLTACLEQGEADLTLQLYEEMQEGGVSPNGHTLVNVLQACSLLAEREESADVDGEPFKIFSIQKGKIIHAEAQWRNYMSDIFLCNALVSMYGKCGSLVGMHCVFEGMTKRTATTWNRMLVAYAEQGQAEKAWQLYEQMQHECLSPDPWTSVNGLQACSVFAEEESQTLLDGRCIKAKTLEKVRAVHADVMMRKHDSNIFVANTLISLYGKCGSIADAESVFDGMPWRNVVSWNALLSACVEQGEASEALHLYDLMQDGEVSPNNRTFVSVLQACGIVAESEDMNCMDGQFVKTKCLEKVGAIHVAAQGKGYLWDVFVASTLVCAYGKCGSIDDARSVFDSLPRRNAICWTAMISAYVRHNQVDKALQLYRLGQQENPSSSESRLVCILQACSKTGSLSHVRQIHRSGTCQGYQITPSVANALILAYGRCSSVVDARTVFLSLPQPDVFSWTALIAAHFYGGEYAASLDCFENLLSAGVKPDAVTFLSVLSSCSHAGFVGKGAEYFQSMTKYHGIAPGIEHYAAMVDLFGRAGYFAMLGELLSSMPVQPDLAIWLSVLGSCQKHGKVELGEQAFRQAVELGPKSSAPYVLMSNIFGDAGLADRANEVMALRHLAGASHKRGQTWVEDEGQMHTFGAGDCKLPSLHRLLSQVNLSLTEECRNTYSKHVDCNTRK